MKKTFRARIGYWIEEIILLPAIGGIVLLLGFRNRAMLLLGILILLGGILSARKTFGPAWRNRVHVDEHGISGYLGESFSVAWADVITPGTRERRREKPFILGCPVGNIWLLR